MKKKLPFSDVRRWQVPFEVHCQFPMLPRPYVLVEEIQTSPAYYLAGNKRSDAGGQIVLTFGGIGGLCIDGTHYRLAPGRAFLHAHRNRSFDYYYPPEGKEPWLFIWISFLGGGVEELIEEINRRYGYVFDAPEGSPLSNFLWSFKRRAGEFLVMPPFEAAKLVYDALQMICDGTGAGSKSTTESRLVGAVQQSIAEDIGQAPSVTELAAQFQVSREHLSRIFATQTGMSPGEYIQLEKLRAASDLLLYSRLSVKEISERCGWSSYPAFYRAFGLKFGVSPSCFRTRGVKPKL